jgi:hypothetical protein
MLNSTMNTLKLTWDDNLSTRDNFYNLWCSGLEYRDAVGLDTAINTAVVVGDSPYVSLEYGTLHFKRVSIERNPERLPNSKYWIKPTFDLSNWKCDWCSFMVFTNLWTGWDDHYGMNIENNNFYITDWLCMNNIKVSVENWDKDGET